jgi:hypothetical protein
MVRLGTETNGVPGDPVNLTGITEISACFRKPDGTELELLKTTNGILVLGSPFLGKLSLILTATDTAELAVVTGATLQITLTYADVDDPVVVQILDAYSVVENTCWKKPLSK